jgi:glycerophosphoryl diester phosphodiesterase
LNADAPALGNQFILSDMRLRLRERGDPYSFATVKMTLVTSCLTVAMSAAITLPAQEMKAPALDLVQASRPLIIAHRGYSSIAPENTLPSFQLALKAGADFVELDSHHTKDGVPMVLHDYTVDRTTDATNLWGSAKIALATKTVAELKTLDAGKWFDTKFAGTKLSTLAEALDTIQGGGGMTLIERKAGDATTMAKLLTEKKLINQLVVQSFDWQFLREFHALQPDQVLGALGVPSYFADGSKPTSKDKFLNVQWLDELVKTGAKIAVWSKDVTKEGVALAHQRGLKVWVYTIDDPKLANELLDMGVDGLITNNTGLLWKTLALRALK